VTGRRTEVTRELVQGANALKADLASSSSSAAGLPEAFELRRPDVDDWSVHEDVRPIAVPGEALETVVIEDFAIEPADEPVIGPEFAAARTRLGLTVDQLAERTRIRPHVIESVEADDFVPCGGDFYARGHIRTLARVLGVDAAPLLASYDERYADAPVNPRRVFEAELAHSGGIKATRGGPNWSVLVAAVMALVLAWSIARLVMDGPVDLRDDPVLNGSGGPNHGGAALAPAVPVVISAPGAGARVIVRDGGGSVVFSGDVAFGASKTLSVSPPVRVQASDGSVTVSVKGEDRGPLGTSGSPGSGTFVVP
jgi:transcriptional regulator with XRE-family HTH domain